MILATGFHVVWRVYPQLDLIQMSGLLSGLALLARRRVITLAVEFADRAWDIPLSMMELVVTHRGATRNIVFDFYDRGDKIVPSAMDFADLYYKRQCGPDTRPAAPSGTAGKIRPLGLTIAGYSLAAWRLVASAIRRSLQTRAGRQAPPGFRRRFEYAYRQARLFRTLPPPDAALAGGSHAKQTAIVFQPRLWETTPGSGDQFDIANQDRLRTIQTMRTAFPSEAGIGLVHSAFAAQLAAECQLKEHVSTSAYHRQLHESAIAVNCVGLSGSVGWKFAEYLAAGNAVVSQPIEKEYLAPIESGVHYLPYASPEECVEQCLRLRGDPSLMARMREVNRAYFLEWVNPPAHVLNLLQQSFA